MWRLKFTDSLTKPLTLPDLPALDKPDHSDLTLLSEDSVPDVLPQPELALQTLDDNLGLSPSIDFLPQNTLVGDVNKTNSIDKANLVLPSLESSAVTQFENPDNVGSETSLVIPEYPIEAVWVMKKSQRLQETEVYYLDHPEMGVLVTIKSYEPELLNPPIDTETAEKFISKISRSLEELGQSEISSNTIGTMVMEGLKELDPVAYVRFASVYRNFREEKDFVQFVDKIDVFKKR